MSNSSLVESWYLSRFRTGSSIITNMMGIGSTGQVWRISALSADAPLGLPSRSAMRNVSIELILLPFASIAMHGIIPRATRLAEECIIRLRTGVVCQISDVDVPIGLAEVSKPI
jgi:hypothetical protein